MSETEIPLQQWVFENHPRGTHVDIPVRLTVDEEDGIFYYEVPEDHGTFREDVRRYPVARVIVDETLNAFDCESNDYSLEGFHCRHTGERVGISKEKFLENRE